MVSCNSQQTPFAPCNISAEEGQSIRSPLIFLIFAATTFSSTHAQKLFSYEQPDPHTIPLPAFIRTLLEHDPDVTDRLTNHEPALTTLPNDWVLCYRISLGPAHETDYLIQANSQLAGANVTAFWVFRMIADQPQQVLFTGGLALEIKPRRSNGLHEIETYAVTMQQTHTETYRFNGTQYIHIGDYNHPH